MRDFKMFRVLGQDAREQLNKLKADLKTREVKEREEGLLRLRIAREKREQLKTRGGQRQAVIAKAKGADFTAEQLAQLNAEIINAKW